MKKNFYPHLVFHLFEASKENSFKIKNGWQEKVFESQNNIAHLTKYFFLPFKR